MEVDVHGVLEQVLAEIIHVKIPYNLILKPIAMLLGQDAHTLMKIKFVI